MHRGARRTRATSLLPRPIRGLFWLLNGPARWDVGATHADSGTHLLMLTLLDQGTPAPLRSSLTSLPKLTCQHVIYKLQWKP